MSASSPSSPVRPTLSGGVSETVGSVEVEGGRIAFTRYGETGRPVVCIPGIGDLRATWRALAPMLVEAGHVVYAIDLRGHGESSTGFPSYAAHDIAADAVALLEAEDLRDALLVGNSIGGGAVCHAAALSDRVGGLVLVNAFVRDMPVERWFRPLVPLIFARPWGSWAWGAYRTSLFRTRPDDFDADQAAVLQNLADADRMYAVRAMLRASKAPVAARLAEVRVPALVLMGSEDPDYTDPAAEGATLRELLSGASSELVMVPGTGHYPQIEKPHETGTAILGFLEGTRGA